MAEEKRTLIKPVMGSAFVELNKKERVVNYWRKTSFPKI